MKPKIWILVFILPFFYSLRPASKATKEAEALIQRVLEGNTNTFVLQEIPAENGKDVFEVDKSNDGKIILRGNNDISLATAFNWYLKEVAHVSYDWQAIKPLSIAGKLPIPLAKIHRRCAVKERFFNNTCTFGYTFVYWDWDEWQRFIDWLAMNGVSRPLMLSGQEAVWLNVWESFGMSEQEVLSYFSAPAHLPWHRMANLDKWGGPLPISYIEGQQRLQQQILNRSRALGMKPILSAFAGHVPENLKKLFPLAKINQIAPGWGGMDASYSTFFLDPADSLFDVIQQRFLQEQQKLYGNDHLYSADPFNEITPPSWEPDYLGKVCKTIYGSMSAFDKEAVWYQMSWTYYNDTEHWTQPRFSAMIHSVPLGKLILLDYVCEQEEYFRRSNNFQGAPFIWCYLGNFGGNTYLVAPLNKVACRIEALKDVSNCLGVGATLEGINVNPGIYEMILEMPWRTGEAFNQENWIKDYAMRRVGHQDEAVIEAWKMLKQDILVDSAVTIGNHMIIYQVAPIVDLNNSNRRTSTRYPYRNAQLARVLAQLFQADEQSVHSDAYKFDIVNLTRQVLGNYGREIYFEMIHEYEQGNSHGFRRTSDKFITLGLELDSLLGNRHEFLLGKWLADARRWGSNESEHNYYERNARQIVTTWYDAGGELDDYSSRQWNGLMRSYYVPRWIEFIKRLDQSMKGIKSFDSTEFTVWCNHFEQDWVNSPSPELNDFESNNAVEYSYKLFLKYRYEIM